MTDLRLKFIEDNYDRLQSYVDRMSDTMRPNFGFGCHVPSEALAEMLQDRDDFYLPLCLLNIFLEHQNKEDQDFVIHSLNSLYALSEDGKIKDEFIAYIYAYCLCMVDKAEESQAIIWKLSDQCFPPALVTAGDGCIAHQEINNALKCYKHAIDHGHLPVTPRFNRIIIAETSLLKSVHLRFLAKIKLVLNLIKVFSIGMKGERALYLDFYDIRYHLHKYWQLPKQERTKRLLES